MKSNVWLRYVLILAPIAGLLHIVLSMCLLSAHIGSGWAYAAGDLLIVAACIFGYVILYKKNASASTIVEPFATSVATPTTASTASFSADASKNRLAVTLAWVSLILCVYALWSVRLNYTGPAYDGVVVSEIKNAKTALPIFSDEWLYAGFARKAAERQELPLFYPFDDSTNATQKVDNLLVPYVSGMAGLMLGTGIDAVDANYVYVFAFQLAFVLIAFAFLRSLRISSLSSVIGVALILLLPESNLFPGIWIMLPAYVGLIWLMAGLALLNDQRSKWMTIGIYANFALAAIIYPPYLILILIGLFARNLGNPKKLLAYIAIAGILGLIVAMVAGFDMRFSAQGIAGLAERAWGLAVRDKVGSATASIWTFIPVVFFLASIAGLLLALWKKELCLFGKKLLLFGSLLLGMIVSCVYLFDKEIVLSHQRTVFLLWVLMIAMICFFVDYIIDRINRKNKKISRAIVAAAFLALAWASVSGAYQGMPPWRGVTAHVDVLADVIPSRPIMLSMLPDGFENMIQDKESQRVGNDKVARFLADPYMSLAIGATTRLMPISASPSFITVVGPKMSDFQKNASCEGKYEFAKDNSLAYVIMHASADALAGCPGFRFDATIGEKYLLYDII